MIDGFVVAIIITNIIIIHYLVATDNNADDISFALLTKMLRTHKCVLCSGDLLRAQHNGICRSLFISHVVIFF